MRKFIACLLSASAALLTPLSALAWGQKGHDVTAYIAETHLTPATKAAIDSLLGGMSLVYWSNWMDNASHTDQYAYTKTWHYRDVDSGKTYDTQPPAEEGDVVTALRYSIQVLGDTATSAEEKVLALKMLDHFAGDLHQPLHMGHTDDLGGNKVNIRAFGRPTNLHSFWDSALLDAAHKWGYQEWAEQIDRLSPTDQVLIISGNLDDWGRQTSELADRVYRAFPSEGNASYGEVAAWAPVAEVQLLKGGWRLAHILNSIFDPDYPNAKPLDEF